MAVFMPMLKFGTAANRLVRDAINAMSRSWTETESS
jgi:hypothetical protein